jgi:tetratricopeptide (TPR) repeat protein
MEEVSEIHVPSTVQAILAARIDRLPPEDKRLLQTASVIGTHVPYSLLSAIAEMSEEEVQRGLSSLQASEFIYETNLFPEREFTFKHALTHDVAYGGLVLERRRALHAAIGEAIEKQAADRLEEHIEHLAHHTFQGGVWDKAFVYSRQAGAKMVARSSHREAVRNYEQALAALKYLPSSHKLDVEGIDLRFDLRNALWPLGDFGRILEILREAETLAEERDDKCRLAWTFSYQTQFFWMIDDLGRALEAGRRALALAEDLGDFALQVETNLRVGQVYHAQGNYRRAMEFSGKNVESLKGDLLEERFGMPGLPSVTSRCVLIWCLVELGEFGEGVAHGEDAVCIAERIDHLYSLVVAHFGLGFARLQKGEFQLATSSLERGLSLCRSGNIRLWFPRVASALGVSYAKSGRTDEALSLLEEAVGTASSRSISAWHSILIDWLGETCLQAGRIEDAAHHAGQALDLTFEKKDRGSRAWALRLLGEIHSHPDALDPKIAEENYRQALALAEELGMRPLQAHCRKGLGALYLRTSREEKGREELTAAMDMYREMEMTFWLEKAEEAMAGANQ